MQRKTAKKKRFTASLDNSWYKRLETMAKQLDRSVDYTSGVLIMSALMKSDEKTH